MGTFARPRCIEEEWKMPCKERFAVVVWDLCLEGLIDCWKELTDWIEQNSIRLEDNRGIHGS